MARRRMMFRRTCEWCGVAFTAGREHARFCSPAHRKAWNRQHAAEVEAAEYDATIPRPALPAQQPRTMAVKPPEPQPPAEASEPEPPVEVTEPVTRPELDLTDPADIDGPADQEQAAVLLAALWDRAAVMLPARSGRLLDLIAALREELGSDWTPSNDWPERDPTEPGPADSLNTAMLANLRSVEGKDNRVRTGDARWLIQAAINDAYRTAEAQYRWAARHDVEDMLAIEREHDAAAGVGLARGTRDLLRAVVRLEDALTQRNAAAFGFHRVPVDERDAALEEMQAADMAASQVSAWIEEARDEWPGPLVTATSSSAGTPPGRSRTGASRSRSWSWRGPS